MGWPLKARRSLYPDWLQLSDESSPQKGSSHSCSHFGGNIQNRVPANRVISQKHYLWHRFVQTCPNSHKIVFSYVRAFPVAQIRPNLHKIVFSCIRAFPSHRFVQTRIILFLAALECFLLHRSVLIRIKSFPAALERFLLHRFVQTRIKWIPAA